MAERAELSHPKQLWVADITYIRLRQEFVFLAVVLDAYSRKVIGWQLGRNLITRLWKPAALSFSRHEEIYPEVL